MLLVSLYAFERIVNPGFSTMIGIKLFSENTLVQKAEFVFEDATYNRYWSLCFI